MATLKKNIKAEATQKSKRELTENQRWIYGFMLLFFSLFVLISVVSYYFVWAEDQHIVKFGSLWSVESAAATNAGGKFGALLANFLVGEWFGVFGVAVPVVLMILALRIMRFRPMVLRRSVRTSLIVMILGSLSLGLVFGTMWDVFGTGLGGKQGIVVAEWLSSFLGFIGTALMLLLSWVLLAVYLNRNTIKVVNKVGKSIADNSMKVGEVVGKGALDFVKKQDKQEEGIEQEEEEDNDDDLAPIPVKTTTVEPEPVVPDSTKISPVPVRTINDIYAGKKPADNSQTAADGVFEITDTLKTAGANDDFEIAAPIAEDGEAKIIAPWEDPKDIRTTPVNTNEDQVKGSFEIIDLTGGDGEKGDKTEGVVAPGSVLNEFEVIEAAPKDVLVNENEIENTLYDPTLELSKYQRPPLELLEDHSIEVVVTEEEVYENKNQILRTLENFGIKIDKIKATIGPTVTLYEIVPAPGVRISKIKNLEDDIALSLSALGIRIIAPMPGKGTIGIEVPNKDKKIVSMNSVVKSLKFQESKYDLPIVLGKTIQNETFVIDLAKMPHLLVAGATGQGKSVGLNAIITSLLYKKHPAELKFVLIDPKKVELTLYSKLEKHFLAKMPGEDDAIITDTHKVVYTLNSLCVEMDSRYDLLRKAEVRHLKEYNDKFTHRRLNPNKGHRFLPHIVVIIDEFADMIMTAGREIETPIARLAQLARAVGIHLVIATQRPTTNIITGVIKANFPARIAFRVTSMIDSRTIIDQPGANQLIGRGDMLVSTGSELIRVQCAFVDTPEIERITEFIGNQKGFSTPYELPEYSPDGESGSGKSVDLGPIDSMFEDVARFVVQNQQGSTSSIQRRFSIGYNRAGRIMDQIEQAGIVGKAEGSKPREVLITDMQSLEMLLSNYEAM